MTKTPQIAIPLEHPFSRLENLIGKDKLQELRDKHVIICGLGGVGSWAAECLVRSGIGNLTIIDYEKISQSNINRQIHADSTTIGAYKVDIMYERLKRINPDCQIVKRNWCLRPENISEIIQGPKNPALVDYMQIDYLIDAIDQLAPKINLLEFCVKNKIPVVTALGAANKLNPALIKVSDIEHTHNCRLGRFVRKKLHQRGINGGFTAVFSTELGKRAKAPIHRKLNLPNQAQQLSSSQERENLPEEEVGMLGTIMYIPAIMGLYCSYVVLNEII